MPEYLERIEFWVAGVPVPQGSHSVFNGHVTDANPKLRAWRKTVAAAATVALAGRDGFDPEDALFILLDFYMPRGKTVRRARPNVKPDGDKLLRAVCDSLTTARVWFDDSRPVTHHVEKWYADDQPGVRVVVGALA